MLEFIGLIIMTINAYYLFRKPRNTSSQTQDNNTENTNNTSWFNRRVSTRNEWFEKHVEPYVIPVLLAFLLVSSVTIYILYH